MISDILSDAIHYIKEYQADMPKVYDSMKPEIDDCLLIMDDLRRELDTPPKWIKVRRPDKAEKSGRGKGLL